MTAAHHTASAKNSPRTTLAFTALALILNACGNSKPSDSTPSSTNSSSSTKTASRISTCKLMPKEDVSKIVGEEFTSTESNDDGHSSESSCVYANATNPENTALRLLRLCGCGPIQHFALAI